MTLLAAVLFVVILFEAFAHQRPLIITYNQRTSLEWLCVPAPLRHHSIEQGFKPVIIKS